jgi:hypothetical protein
VWVTGAATPGALVAQTDSVLELFLRGAGSRP